MKSRRSLWESLRPRSAGLGGWLILLCQPLASLWAQALGDPAQERPYTLFTPRADLPLSPVLTPSEQQQTFQLPPGFRIELVAAEPLVHDPVAVAFDGQGYLWVAEMSGFNAEMPNHVPDLADGAGEFPPGKIVKLGSSRRDGHYDQRTVFLDGLRSPRALAILHDGVLVADPPHLWLARDVDGDGRADEKHVISSTYGHRGDDESSANGLLWGRDNLIHNVSHGFDFRRRDGEWEEVPIPIRGQFGISQDDFGRFVFTRNSQHLRGDLFSPHYARRHPAITEWPWTNVVIAPEQTVWPSRPTPAVNRGYQLAEADSPPTSGGVRADGTLRNFTAACGTVIYRGANFPASFYHNAFVPEPAANLVKRTLLLEAEGQLRGVNAYQGREFLTSTDERFRPVAAANAPDGSLIIVDLYRGIIEQYNFISSYLKQQTLQRQLHRPLHGQGRIWRVVYEGGPREMAAPAFASLDAIKLAQLLTHPNGWWRDTAQQALVERGDRRAVPVLESLATQAQSEASRVAALWTLDGLEALTPAMAHRALSDPSGKVRAAAVRLHERWLATPQADEFLARLRAVVADPDPAVAVQLALSLGEARTPGALPAMIQVLEVVGAHPLVPKAVASGLAGRELAFLEGLRPRLSLNASPSQREILTVLSSAIARGRQPDQGQGLAAYLRSAELPAWARLALLEGWSGLSLRPELEAALDFFSRDSDPAIVGRAKQLQGQLRAREARLQAGRGRANGLTEAERQLAEYGRGAYAVCAGCHQPDGTGLAGVAPSLVDSPWVGGRPEALIRILLHGKEGTPGFAAGMPSASSFRDMQIAGLLTYIRNAWGLRAGAISPDLVTQVRQETISRLTPWTDAELQAIK